MEWFRQWLIGITTAAMLNALAKSLMPKGVVQQIGRLTGGLVLLLAILHPIYQLDEGMMEAVFSPYIGQIEAHAEIPESENFSFMKTIIEEECGAYIQDKAKEQGMECRAAVTCSAEEDEYPYPKTVLVSGALNESQRSWLEEMIETDLGIPKQAQRYRAESGETN